MCDVEFANHAALNPKAQTNSDLRSAYRRPLAHGLAVGVVPDIRPLVSSNFATIPQQCDWSASPRHPVDAGQKLAAEQRR